MKFNSVLFLATLTGLAQSAPSTTTTASVPSRVPSPRDINGALYVGCFGDRQSPRALGNFIQIIGVVSVIQDCRDAAFKAGATYFGVQWGNECYYNALPNPGLGYNAYGPASVCTRKCGDNTGSFCGGGQMNDVYQVVAETSIPIPVHVPSPRDFNGGLYVGCFKDSVPRVFNTLVHMIEGVNIIQDCRDAAKIANATFFGVQLGHECYFNVAHRPDPGYYFYGASDGCTMKCSDGSNSFCGGIIMNDVYVVVEKTAVSVSILPGTSVSTYVSTKTASATVTPTH